MQTGQYSTSQFARDVDTCVRKCPNESEVLRQIKPPLEKFIRNPGSVPSEAFTPRKDRFAMNLIHMPRDEMFSVIGGVWHPGQTTPIHDHLTWTLIGVYDGEEREALFRRTDNGSISRLRRSRRSARRSTPKDT
jgi:predicted metal-dependent enzyme (double-stranded beta helix superfamily)